MKILFVVATYPEIEPLLKRLSIAHSVTQHTIEFTYGSHQITCVITGVGVVATTYHTTKILLAQSFDLCLNIGICGSFNRNLSLGDVVNIYDDTLSELGAEDNNNFLCLEDLNLLGVSRIVNRSTSSCDAINNLPKVNGITVNTAHGNEQSIERVVKKFRPTTESMEGAGFMFVCENEKLNYFQLRAVSNYVEVRNKGLWNIPLAVNNLNEMIVEFLDSL
jgi:futalosine hydrolase